MKRVYRVLRPGGALVALAAMLAGPDPARADLQLTISEFQGGVPNTQSTGVIQFTGGNYTGTQQSFTFGDYTVLYTISAVYNPSSPSTQTITLQATVQANNPDPDGVQPANFSYQLTGTPFSQPGSSGDTVYLGSALSATFTPGSLTGTESVNTTATVNMSGSLTPTSVSPGGLFSGGPAGPISATTPVTMGTSYSLHAIGGSFTATSTSNYSFTATASIALPEPAGIAAGVLGLPCLGLLGVYARRRLGGGAVPAAV